MTATLHQEERLQFERLLKQVRLDRVPDRLAVLEAFLATEDHLSADGWQRLLRKNGHDLEPEFVANTLDLLTKYGLATRRHFNGGPPVYEHRHLGDHHDHLICTRCGGITEFNAPALQGLTRDLQQETGFLPLQHRLQIYGLCPQCLAKREPSIPLTLAIPGERLRVERVMGGDKVSNQLADLGICPGTQLEVISGGHGPVVVAVRGTRLALGRGAALKIYVSSAVSAADDSPVCQAQ
ncbi:MAG: transcriptional repressor [Deltaproteobacteria bacterium]|nr:transcriptional repressor [Deltaproteobacteria bacterium]